MGLKIRSLESGGVWNTVRYFLRSLTGHAQLWISEITTSRPRRSWSFLLLGTLITMNPSLKEMSFLLILETSANLKKPANDKTYKVILRSSTGLSRLEQLIISWIALDSRLLTVNSSSTKNSFWRRPDGLDNRVGRWGGDTSQTMCPFYAHFMPILCHYTRGIRCWKYNAT